MIKFTLGTEKLVILSLSNIGANLFPNGVEGQMRFFHIYAIDKCNRTGGSILIGNWLDDIQSYPPLLERNYPIEIRHSQDERITEYQDLTKAEEVECIRRLEELAENNPYYSEKIESIIKNINKKEEI